MTVLFLKVFIRENIDTREALDQVDQEDNTGCNVFAVSGSILGSISR